jgi:hypothetical protein
MKNGDLEFLNDDYNDKEESAETTSLFPNGFHPYMPANVDYATRSISSSQNQTRHHDINSLNFNHSSLSPRMKGTGMNTESIRSPVQVLLKYNTSQ